MKANNNTECLSWNCCDEYLHECIERSKFVKNIRTQLKNKKLEKCLNSLLLK